MLNYPLVMFTSFASFAFCLSTICVHTYRYNRIFAFFFLCICTIFIFVNKSIKYNIIQNMFELSGGLETLDISKIIKSGDFLQLYTLENSISEKMKYILHSCLSKCMVSYRNDI